MAAVVGAVGCCWLNSTHSQWQCCPAIGMLSHQPCSHHQVHTCGKFQQSRAPQATSQAWLSAADYAFAITIKYNRGFGRSAECAPEFASIALVQR